MGSPRSLDVYFRIEFPEGQHHVVRPQDVTGIRLGESRASTYPEVQFPENVTGPSSARLASGTFLWEVDVDTDGSTMKLGPFLFVLAVDEVR